MLVDNGSGWLTWHELYQYELLHRESIGFCITAGLTVKIRLERVFLRYNVSLGMDEPLKTLEKAIGSMNEDLVRLVNSMNGLKFLP
jgi:hypothetical protein